MTTPKTVKNILNDMDRTVAELQKKGILNDYRAYSIKSIGQSLFEISYPNKNEKSSIVFDKHVTGGTIMDTLLKNLQYNVLFYDKSFIQAEFIVNNNEVIKERLVFMKKHNKIGNKKEIEQFEIRDEDWFAEEFGVPIVMRIDFAPKDHVEGDHAKTHLTLSNHESCRIPIKGIVTFSEFVRFIVFHFYNIKMDLKVYRSSANDTITEIEKKMIHINWN